MDSGVEVVHHTQIAVGVDCNPGRPVELSGAVALFTPTVNESPVLLEYRDGVDELVCEVDAIIRSECETCRLRCLARLVAPVRELEQELRVERHDADTDVLVACVRPAQDVKIAVTGEPYIYGVHEPPTLERGDSYRMAV